MLFTSLGQYTRTIYTIIILNRILLILPCDRSVGLILF